MSELKRREWAQGEKECWLADKIVAYDDYTKEAAFYLRKQAEEIAKLRSDLEEYTKLIHAALDDRDFYLQRAEAAEAKLNALQEQEPVNYLKITGRLASMPRGDGTRLIGFVVEEPNELPLGDVQAGLTMLLGKLYTEPTRPSADLIRELKQMRKSLITWRKSAFSDSDQARVVDKDYPIIATLTKV